MKAWGQKQAGFTIIELLIVIVVIAILAAISLVAYNGIQERAKTSALQSDITQAVKKLEVYKLSQNGGEQYPPSLEAAGIKTTGTNQLQYVYTRASNTYCLRGLNGTTSYYMYNTSASPQAGTCSIINYTLNPQLGANNANYTTQTPTGNTWSRVTGLGPNNEAVFRVATTNSGQVRINIALANINTGPGEQFNVSFWLHSSLALSNVSIECGFGIGWYAFPIDAVVTGWRRYNAVVTVPSGSTSLQACQLLTSPVVNVPSGAVFMVTKVQATTGPTLYDFADGTTPGWSWGSTPNNSTSFGPAP